MFQNNLFSGVTQQKLTSDSVAAMSASDIEALLNSAAAMKQLGTDAAAKKAALRKLSAAYDTPAERATAAGQAAAMAAAALSIKTVPDASQFSSSAIGLITSLSFSSATTPASVTDALKSILPSDIAGKLSSSTQPPAAFTTMIEAFTSANSAYVALSSGVTATSGYADSSLGSNDKMEIAADAAISGILSAVVPATPGESSAAALWAALRDPANADSQLSFGDISTIASPTGTIGGLLTAADLTL
jgi:hypothetical protein